MSKLKINNKKLINENNKLSEGTFLSETADEGKNLKEEKERILKEFQRIKGIDKKTSIALYNAGIRSLGQLEKAKAKNLSKLIGIDENLIKNWIQSVPALLSTSEVENSVEILSSLLNISQKVAEKLRNVGVFSVKHLADEDANLLADDLDEPVKTVTEWIKRAKTEMKSKEK